MILLRVSVDFLISVMTYLKRNNFREESFILFIVLGGSTVGVRHYRSLPYNGMGSCWDPLPTHVLVKEAESEQETWPDCQSSSPIHLQ